MAWSATSGEVLDDEIYRPDYRGHGRRQAPIKKVIELREQGCSFPEIAARIGCVRGAPFQPETLARLYNKFKRSS